MKLKEVLKQTRKIRIPQKGYPVERTIAEELLQQIGGSIDIQAVKDMDMKSEKWAFYIAVADENLKKLLSQMRVQLPSEKEWIAFSVDENMCCWLISSKPYFLYAAFSYVMENMLDSDVSRLKKWVRKIAFDVEKSTFDLFLTQYARLIRKFKREHYIREYARLGFTHIEVNALAFPFPYEKGIPGEFYSHFYTYAPALDQFVQSSLNHGTYPAEYLQANLELLKKNAQLVVKYGLVPGLLCFEPRSVPESLFEKYPTLRGARVDHPFRSFKPRFNLSIVHPVVQNHYAELMTNLMKNVPELEFLTIWTNDSGAGFEYTKSLYVGRNGGAYLIREWKDDEQIAKASASNIVNFFRLMRDAASQINPKFRVITRLEPFYGERQYLWPNIRERIDVEVNSLLASGWENNYQHPEYRDVNVLGSAYHNTLKDEEKAPMEELHLRNSRSLFFHSFCAHTNHEPLLGIPFPWLTHEKLHALFKGGIKYLAHMGGIHPPDKVPYAVNQEVFRLFQIDPELDIDQTVHIIGEKYAGREHVESLVRGWKLVEQAIRCFMPLPLYSHFGVVWQRLFVRPLVPDIDRIPEEERSYYEKFMCTSIHNPNRVDLAKDVLFELVSKEYAYKAYTRIDENVWKPLDEGIGLFKREMEETHQLENIQGFKVFEDQYFRARALKCLYETLRNTAVWIYAIHTYLGTKEKLERAHCRNLLNEMIEREIHNARELSDIWRTAPIEWLIVSGSEETPFIHGENFAELLEKKIMLMEKHTNDEPFIDSGYMFRVSENPYEES
ncbi:MAG: hypothetical protein IBX60_06940 [Candidatus Aminicenantes bacterium]|nr:hypothetical protein [Candidatus Aminicenantes bacterium]